MHPERHPKSGKRVRIVLEGEDLQAIEDRDLQGKIVKLVDWVDRVIGDNNFRQRDIEVALMFYAHRCLPDLPPADPIPLGWISLHELVCGLELVTWRGSTSEQLVVVRECELKEVDSL